MSIDCQPFHCASPSVAHCRLSVLYLRPRFSCRPRRGKPSSDFLLFFPLRSATGCLNNWAVNRSKLLELNSSPHPIPRPMWESESKLQPARLECQLLANNLCVTSIDLYAHWIMQILHSNSHCRCVLHRSRYIPCPRWSLCVPAGKLSKVKVNWLASIQHF